MYAISIYTHEYALHCTLKGDLTHCIVTPEFNESLLPWDEYVSCLQQSHHRWPTFMTTLLHKDGFLSRMKLCHV